MRDPLSFLASLPSPLSRSSSLKIPGQAGDSAALRGAPDPDPSPRIPAVRLVEPSEPLKKRGGQLALLGAGEGRWGLTKRGRRCRRRGPEGTSDSRDPGTGAGAGWPRAAKRWHPPQPVREPAAKARAREGRGARQRREGRGLGGGGQDSPQLRPDAPFTFAGLACVYRGPLLPEFFQHSPGFEKAQESKVMSACEAALVGGNSPNRVIFILTHSKIMCQVPAVCCGHGAEHNKILAL